MTRRMALALFDVSAGSAQTGVVEEGRRSRLKRKHLPHSTACGRTVT